MIHCKSERSFTDRIAADIQMDIFEVSKFHVIPLSFFTLLDILTLLIIRCVKLRQRLGGTQLV